MHIFDLPANRPVSAAREFVHPTGTPQDNGDGSYTIPANWAQGSAGPGLIIKQPGRPPVTAWPAEARCRRWRWLSWLLLLLVLVLLILLVILLLI